jgi:ComF family protein
VSRDAPTLEDETLWHGRWWELALDWLYPVRCEGCGTAISFRRQRLLCHPCRSRVEWLPPARSCRRCAARLGPHVEADAACPECRTRGYRFTRAVAAATYEEPMRGLIHACKFRGNRHASRPLGALVAARVRREAWAGSLTAVVPVPLHPRRQRERGYNQSGLLARDVAGALGLPLRAGALRRVRDTVPQARLGREERLANPREAFAPARTGPELASCLLVDDVMTTGATASEAAAALRRGGAQHVYVAVVGRST